MVLKAKRIERYHSTEKTEGNVNMEAINESSKLVAQALENIKQHDMNCPMDSVLFCETVALLEQVLEILTEKM